MNKTLAALLALGLCAASAGAADVPDLVKKLKSPDRGLRLGPGVG